jgi:hypothetical protein
MGDGNLGAIKPKTLYAIARRYALGRLRNTPTPPPPLTTDPPAAPTSPTPRSFYRLIRYTNKRPRCPTPAFSPHSARVQALGACEPDAESCRATEGVNRPSECLLGISVAAVAIPSKPRFIYTCARASLCLRACVGTRMRVSYCAGG